MGSIADFTQSETWAIENTLKERWPKLPAWLQPADVEIKLYPDDHVLTEVSAASWQVGEASFVIIKVGDRSYRSQFY
jgi:hypothetical protein